MRHSHLHLARLILLALLAATVAGCATSGGRMHRSDDSASSRENAAKVHTQLAWHLMQQGKNKVALEKLQTALRFDRDYVPAHTVMGILYTHIGSMAKAEKHYRRAVKLKPTDGDTNNNLGRFLCQQGKTSEAMPYFKKALADPFYKTRGKTLTNAGACQIRAGHYQRAEAELDKALKMNADSPGALYQMARAYYLDGDAFRASAYIERYQGSGHASADALKLGYDIETRLGNGEGARTYARQLRKRFPDSEQAQALDTQPSP